MNQTVNQHGWRHVRTGVILYFGYGYSFSAKLLQNGNVTGQTVLISFCHAFVIFVYYALHLWNLRQIITFHVQEGNKI